jgi:hypothetical protein
VDVTADTHFSGRWVGKLESPAGLLREPDGAFSASPLKASMLSRQATDRAGRRALTRAGLSSRSATEPRLARLGPSGFDP